MLKNMDKHKKILLLSSLIAVLMIGSIAVSTTPAVQNTVPTSSTAGLSTQTIGWGIKRVDDHKQPDLGKRNKELIEKYHGLAMGSGEKKYVYLTFDLGYEAGYTNAILDTLKENQVPAAFFITAHYVNTSADIIQRMIDEGHIVGNQSPHALMELWKSRQNSHFA